MRLRDFSLELARPLGTAKGEIRERRGFLVGVEHETDDGDSLRGVGEAAPLPPWTESFEDCEAQLRELSERVNRGRDDANLDALGAAAHHAVDLSSNDLEAREAGVSLAEWLAETGGIDRVAATVPVNATVGDDDPESTAEAAADAVADGFECIKVKVGARDVDADLDRLRAVRDAVADDVTLRADANGAWSREEALRAVETLDDLDFAYLEQPLAADDHEGHKSLRGRGVDVALDESVNGAGEWPPAKSIADYADVVVLKPMAQGGPGPTVSIARHLRNAGVAPVVTTTIDAVVARTAAVHVAAAVPDVPACGLATGGLLAEDLAADPRPVEEGEVRVPTEPGLCGDAFEDLVF